MKPEDMAWVEQNYAAAVALVCTTKRTELKFIQSELKATYTRAAELIDRMARDGIISEPQANGRRKILRPFAHKPHLNELAAG